MNKSSKYKQQQTEPKQCKYEVEELRIHQNLETGHCSILPIQDGGFRFGKQQHYHFTSS